MQRIILICACLCIFAIEAHAGNKGYLAGGPKGQLFAETEPIEVSPKTVQKPCPKNSLRQEALSGKINIFAGIKKMDDWIKENLW